MKAIQETQVIKFTSKADMARRLGINKNTATTWAGLPGFPGGASGPWLLPDIIRWLISRTNARPESDDPAMSGPDSPALERYRLAKAELSELELAEKRKQLLPRGVVRQALASWAAILRNAGDQLGRRFGVGAQRVLTDALDGCHDATAAIVAERLEQETNAGGDAKPATKQL